MKKGKSPQINGDGTYSETLYIENAVSNILALTTTNPDTFGQAFNIGTGGRITLIELVDLLIKPWE